MRNGAACRRRTTVRTRAWEWRCGTVAKGRPKNVGVVGLGAGTVAAYGEAGDRMRFYEINPLVEPIARNFFTYWETRRAAVSVVEGDGRAMLSREAPQGFDVLVVDAFSGDAIPLHLLTREAMVVYRRQLAQWWSGGVPCVELVSGTGAGDRAW